ncbi:MAG: RHS repeat protein [Chlamydiales bacterium]|nr:RHS repeat protein [Chlamydiales bacterium]
MKRTFHFYDDKLNAVCVKTIVDDGRSDDPNDLSAVAYRKIVEADPKRTFPCLGLPEEIREKTIDASGHEVLLKKIRYTYHPSGKIACEDHYDADNVYRYSILNEYDTHERLAATVDPLGNRTTYSYDENFNPLCKKGPLTETKWRYDRANRPIAQSRERLERCLTYDRSGLVIAKTDPCGNRTQYSYDGLGRLSAISHPDGAVEQNEYDALGNVIKVVDQNGYETRKEYNFRGQPTSIYYPDGSEEYFSYNSDGGTLFSHIDHNGLKTIYTYDIFDNCIKTESPYKTTSALFSPFYKRSETDPDGVETFYEYDFAGRKKAERKAGRLIVYSYDSLGRLNRVQKGETVYVTEYDLLDRVVEKRSEDLQGNLHFQEKYLYDSNGNQTHIITCLGVAETKYNGQNHPVSWITQDGHLTTICYDYNRVFKKTTTNPKGVQCVEIYDSCGRLVELNVQNVRGETIQRRIYEYDKAGNRIKTHEHVYEGVTPLKVVTNTWEYGPLGRVQKQIESDIKETT